MSKSPPPPPPRFRRWGLDSAFAWFITAHVLVLLTTGLATWLSGHSPSNLSVPYLLLATSGLWLGYGVGPLVTARRWGRGPRADFGTTVEAADIPIGLALGAFTQFVLIWLLYWPLLRWVIDSDPADSARELVDRVNNPVDVIVLILIVVVFAPLVEEIFFRGLLLSALQTHVGDHFAVLVSAGLFAIVHLIPVNIPGLFMFGVIAGYLRLRFNRLGVCWFFHAGFNAVTLATLLLS